MIINSNIIRYIGFYLMQDCLVCQNNSHGNKIKYVSLSKTNKKIVPSENSDIDIHSKFPIQVGWYLFGIKHRWNNNRCFGTIKTGEYGHPQARPMYPVRRRWRVLHIRNSSIIRLKLEGIEKELNLEELFLIKIPEF